jgi:hypothetical protein
MNTKMTDTQRQDMRREIVLREINQGALAGMPSDITASAADLVLNALDAFDNWSREHVSRDLIEAEALELQAIIYQATPDRETTYGDVAHQLSEHARLAREDHAESLLRAARKGQR